VEELKEAEGSRNRSFTSFEDDTAPQGGVPDGEDFVIANLPCGYA
jgi:hypothetical protein